MLLLKDSAFGSFCSVANPTLTGPTECSKISLFWEDVTGQVQAYDPRIPPSKKITTCPRGHRDISRSRFPVCTDLDVSSFTKIQERQWGPYTRIHSNHGSKDVSSCFLLFLQVTSAFFGTFTCKPTQVILGGFLLLPLRKLHVFLGFSGSQDHCSPPTPGETGDQRQGSGEPCRATVQPQWDMSPDNKPVSASSSPTSWSKWWLHLNMSEWEFELSSFLITPCIQHDHQLLL